MQIIISSLELFIIFFKIGLFTFGGGYSMIPFIEKEIVVSNNYVGQNTFFEMIAISESTPGPFAVNIATFSGYKIGGVLGAFFATLGVVLPSFLIILLISTYFTQIFQKKEVKIFFKMLLLVITGFIFATTLLSFMNVLKDDPVTGFNYYGIIILCLMAAIVMVRKKIKPISVIFLSGLMGMIFYTI